VIYGERSVPPYRFRQGSVPLVVSMPHSGTWIPPSLSRDMTDAALLRADQSPATAQRALGFFAQGRYQGDLIEPRPHFARAAP
jgi:N-formylglutamate amidohydrolase